MGHDPMAVVDDRLRVHGISGLRIADASIMPTMISGNTSVPCMMVGEKCADMVLADAEHSDPRGAFARAGGRDSLSSWADPLAPFPRNGALRLHPQLIGGARRSR